MVTVLVFILILSILILAHEFGHFLTAKKSGVKIEEFGIGFPPRIWGKKGKDDIIYSVNAIPLGGFVKLKGESGEEREEEDSFSHQPARIRALILSAGVLMNVILAYVLFSLGFMFGLPVSISSEQIDNPEVRGVKVQIVGVAKNSAAEQAGIKTGDQILSVDGQEIITVEQFQQYIGQNQTKELDVRLSRNNKEQEMKVTPQEMEGFAEGKVLGVNLIQTGIVRYGFFRSWYEGLLAVGNLLIVIILAFYDLFKNLILGMGVSVDLSGPVGVAVMTGQVVSLGWVYVLQFIALLSLNLAVINFLPFPALDGGRFLFLIIEKFRRRPNNQKIENLFHNIGFTLLMLLIVVITYRDIIRYGGSFLEKIKGLF